MKNNHPKTKSPTRWLEEIEAIKVTADADHVHSIKRAGSYLWTNSLVSDCASRECPYRYLKASLIYALADISIEQYLTVKAQHLSEAKPNFTYEAAYKEAVRRVESVFDCPLPPKVGCEIFDHDNEELTNLNDRPIQYKGARARRAYWLYLKHQPENNPYIDYVATCAYIEQVTRLSSKMNPSKDDLVELEQLIRGNYAIATPIDLYRFCCVRRRVSS